MPSVVTGTLLLRRLARRAGEVGIHSVTGDILAENHPTMKLARRLGARSWTTTDRP